MAAVTEVAAARCGSGTCGHRLGGQPTGRRCLIIGALQAASPGAMRLRPRVAPDRGRGELPEAAYRPRPVWLAMSKPEAAQACRHRMGR